MSVKISIVGAGSAIFSLNLVRDICLTANLRDSTISFMDIDQPRLDAVHKLASRYADEAGIRLTIEKTIDRRESVKGADFVINTALAGSHDHLREGWKIASRHGYHFGASLHVIHDEAFWINFYQLRLMEDILKDILELSPNAWYVLVANPVMAGTTYLKRKYPQANVVGMCHGFSGVYHLADVLGFERDKISFEIPGVNHFVWLNKFEHKEENAFPVLDKWIAENYDGAHIKGTYTGDIGPKAIDLYKRFGVFPIGDTGTWGGGAWGYWYHSDRKTEERWKQDPVGAYKWYFKAGLDGVKKIHDTANDLSVRVTDLYATQRSVEPMIPLVEAIACDTERVVVVNIMNDGEFVDGVPKNFEVEVPAVVSKRGIEGIRTTPLPKPIQAWLLRDYVAPTEIELEAYVTGSRELLLQVILMDPWSKSEAQAKGLLEEILALPYHEEMRRHYS